MFRVIQLCVCSQRLGCDNMLESLQEEDPCLQCGGNGQACSLVKNSFSMRNLPKGKLTQDTTAFTFYMYVPVPEKIVLSLAYRLQSDVHHPCWGDHYTHQGNSTNAQLPWWVYVSKILILIFSSASLTVLSLHFPLTAIKNLRGEYYLNGHWVIDVSRATSIAGTVLYYQRGTEGEKTPEIITGRGPTTEPLVIEVRARLRFPRFVCVLINVGSRNAQLIKIKLKVGYG